MALKCLNTEKLDVADTAVGFTAGEFTVAGGHAAIKAVCTVETAAVRINCKETPVSGGAEGSHLANVGDTFEVVGFDDIKNFKAIRETATSGVIMVAFYEVP